MKIRKVTLTSGTELELGKFTLLVGPNNVGKSQTLKDIHKKLIHGSGADTTLLASVDVSQPDTFERLLEDLDVRVDATNIGHHTIDGITSGFEQNSMVRLRLDQARRTFESTPDADFTFQKLGKFRVFYMDSESRLKIASTCQNFVPEESSPKTLLQAMYGKFGELDQVLADAFETTFGMKVRLDYSAGLKLRYAISSDFGDIPDDPRAAYPRMKQFPSLESQGDGFRSFVAVVLSLLLSKDKVVLLDEPEAFLHPEQARRLGRWMADHIDAFPCQVIVATHNSNFLAGVLSGKQPAEIFRLNRTGNKTEYCPITAEATQALSSSPILSSQRVLEGIFARGAVVCEADSDRIVYSAVATHVHDNQELLFVHAHNKQTIKDVVALLKQAAIPVAAIVDVDLLNSEADLRQLLRAFDADAENAETILLRNRVAESVEKRSEAEVLTATREAVVELLAQLDRGEHTLSGAKGALSRIRSESSKWSLVKASGVAALDMAVRPAAEQIIANCKAFGLFLVPKGELEGWMNLGVRKNRWVVPALEHIVGGDCPEDLSNFVSEVAQFVYGADGS
ncbi:ATP-dependent endonuclease [Vreelandella venusta]|uniref:ATP-dependent nuclease n=1 Tax=Vreelandella venusta TaxID=44935 RepID=UPI0035587B03